MTWSPPPPRGAHPYYMHDSIFAQPDAVRAAVAANAEGIARAAERLRAMERTILCGIGTSYHAALVGELLLARVGGLGYRARALHSFELATYWPAPPPRTGVIAISHRGSKRFSQEALARAKSEGGVGIALTGKGAAALGEAEVSLETVEQERSSAHAASYTATLTVLAALAAAVGREAAFTRRLEPLADQLAALLGQEPWDELAGAYGGKRRYWFVGGGPNTATAYEAALKMSETNYATASGFNCEQFLHGAYASMTGDDVLVLIAPPGPAHARCLDAARAAKAIGTPIVALAARNDREIAGLAARTIALPEVDELLSPILAIVPLQLFAYHLAVRQGVNPDTVRRGEPLYAAAARQFTL
ncbi:MAG TPA: SIS domain-containing protein [Terriglobales bacterium]|nr:SIS domain-containing protein [Terriglobales bacterium]